MTDTGLLKKITDGRLAKLIAAKMSDAKIVDELFLATLARLPDEGEKAAALERVSAAPDRDVLVDRHPGGSSGVSWPAAGRAPLTM